MCARYSFFRQGGRRENRKNRKNKKNKKNKKPPNLTGIKKDTREQ